MTNKKQMNVEKLVKFVKETPEEELMKLAAEVMPECMYELCMETLKEKDRDLNLTDECKKCYDYLTEQFILNYIDDKSMFDLIDDTSSGKYYNTWLVFLGIVKHIVKAGGKLQLLRGVEDMVNNSGISKETLLKFLDCYSLGANYIRRRQCNACLF